MAKLTEREIVEYIEQHIDSFHSRRLESLTKLKLRNVITRKNPYLFRAKNVVSGPDLVRSFLDAYLSSQEEGIFGTFLEGLARFICERVYSGHKSAAEGIDLEFTKKGVTYIVAIKSGPNWGNASQIRRMVDNFRKAKRILQTNIGRRNVVAVNGCGYGKTRVADQGDYLKLCGQDFWEFISGNRTLYIDIIEPLGHRAKERNEAFQSEYAKVITRFTGEFISDFCNPDGGIIFEKVLKFNSGSEK
jgi:Type II restriction endonuclease EcoO109I